MPFFLSFFLHCPLLPQMGSHPLVCPLTCMSDSLRILIHRTLKWHHPVKDSGRSQETSEPMPFCAACSLQGLKLKELLNDSLLWPPLLLSGVCHVGRETGRVPHSWGNLSGSGLEEWLRASTSSNVGPWSFTTGARDETKRTGMEHKDWHGKQGLGWDTRTGMEQKDCNRTHSVRGTTPLTAKSHLRKFLCP